MERERPQGINESANFRFLQRLSVIFGFRRDCPRSLASCRDCCTWKIASCRDYLCDSASCRESRQEAESHGQSQQVVIFVDGSLGRKQEITDSLGGSSLCRKRKLADSFTPCGDTIFFSHFTCKFKSKQLKKIIIQPW